MKLSSLILLPLICLAFFQPARCVEGLYPDGSLNKELIANFYFYGDFQKVIAALEHFRKHRVNPKVEENIFVFKHLGVIYASRPETQEKGESYFNQLLNLAPDADLITDMYISKRIDSIFQEVKQDFKRIHSKTSNSLVRNNDLPAKPASSIDTLPTPSVKKSSNSWIYWTVGTAVIVGTATAFLLLPDRDETPPDTVGH